MTLSARPSVRSVARVAAVVPLLASLMVAGSVAKVGPSAAGCAQAATLHHAALVVDYPGATTVTRCIAFTEDSITGDQLLARSGVEYATAYSGQAVCQINLQPAQYPATCWTSSSPYWAFYVSRGGGTWAFSNLGIGSQTFRDGDAEGFRYEAQSDYSVPPSPAGVCPTPAPPTPTAVPTSRPSASAMTAHPSQRPSTRPAVPAATGAPAAASAGGNAVAPLATAGSPPSSTVRPTVAALGAAPPPSPPSLNPGAFAAGGLGVVLVVLLIAQVTGWSRRASRQRSQS